MNYLLDTHILVWWMFKDKRLNKKIIDILHNTQDKIYVSVVSIWEIMIKKGINKLTTPKDIIGSLKENGFEILAINHDHAMKIGDLSLIHKDPFDRMLIAQAMVEDLTLITMDSNIQKYPRLKCV